MSDALGGISVVVDDKVPAGEVYIVSDLPLPPELNSMTPEERWRWIGAHSGKIVLHVPPTFSMKLRVVHDGE